MIKHLAIKFTASLMIALILIGTPGFDFLLLKLEHLNKDANVVDKFWLLSKEQGVVDNFMPLGRAISRLKAGLAQAAVANNGLIMKGSNASAGTFYYMTVTNPNTFGGETTVGFGSSASGIAQVVTKASPVRNEWLSAQLKVDGRLDAVRRNAAGSHSAEWNIAGVTSAMTCDATAGSCWRPFDIGYEQLKGRGMIVYGKNATAGTVYYNIYNGGGWVGEASIAITGSTGVPKWIRLIPEGEQLTNKRSNRILLVMMDANSDIFAAIWDGSNWTNQAVITNTGSVIHSQSFDGAWETASGNALVVYSEGAANSANPFRHKRFITGTGNWDATSVRIGTWTNSIGRWVKLASSPLEADNFIGIIAQASDATTITTSHQTRPFMWDGDAATSTPGTAYAAGESAINAVLGVAFEKITGDAIFTYSTANGTADNSARQLWTRSSTSFGANVDITGTLQDDVNIHKLYGSPNSDEIRLVGGDIDKIIRSQRWSGSGWNAAFSANLGTAVYPALANTNQEYGGFDYAWTPYSPWSRNWEWFDDEGSATPSVSLAGENLGANIEQSNTVRLRFQAAELGGQAATASRKKLQYTSCANPDADSCVWTDVDDQAGVGIWRYADGAGTDDGTFASTVLTGSDAIGVYVENGTAASTFGHGAAGSASDIPEWDFTIENNNAPVGTNYYFRMKANDQDLAIFREQINGATTYSYPSATSTAITRNLTVGATAGSAATSLSSGLASQYFNATNCDSPANCAAFTFSLDNLVATVTSIKISEIGTVAANTDLANASLFYDTDGNFANGTVGQFGSATSFDGSQTATFNGTLPISSANTYYLYIRYDLKNGANYPVGGQTVSFRIASDSDVTTTADSVAGSPITLTGSTAVTPDATGTTWGSGLSDGGRSGESITISGYGFGTAPGGSQENCSGAVNTGCVRFVVGGSDTVLDADVTSWSNTSVSFTINANLDSYGGTAALELVAGSQADASDLSFIIYPNIVAPSSIEANAAREYDAADNDGLVMLTGDHFGAAGSVTILGSTATQHVAAAGPCLAGGYSSTTVCLEVPAAISDSLYSGNIVLTRAGDSKASTYANFNILPRVTGTSIGSGTFGDPVTVQGNHLCNGGSCPSAFDGSNKVTFTSGVDATVFAGWSHTAVNTAIPAGSATGDVTVTTNTKISNGFSITVIDPTSDDPTVLRQYRDAGLTQLLPVGEVSSSTPIYLKIDMQAGVSGGTLYPQFEILPIGSSFVCGAGACATDVEGAGVAGPGPVIGSTAVSPADNVYHWQARIRHNIGGSDYYSAWVPYPDDAPNSEAATDFQIDTAGAAIGFPGGGSCPSLSPDTNKVTIAWTLDQNATGQLMFSKNVDLSSGTYMPILPASPATSHSFDLINLDSNTAYYFKVIAVDGSGITTEKPTGQPYCSFVTANVTQPAKTTSFYVAGLTGMVPNAGGTSTDFSIFVPETGASIKNAFIEITGITPSAGTNNITVAVNSLATSTYAMAAGESMFKVSYPVSGDNLNLDPATNRIEVLPSLNMNILSARIYITYSFAP